jgi:hypothetical protein
VAVLKTFSSTSVLLHGRDLNAAISSSGVHRLIVDGRSGVIA